MLSHLCAQASSVISLPQRIRQNKGWSQIAVSAGPSAVLGFGGVLSGGGLIHGGVVKLLSLRDALAHNEQNFNVLYLVSSAQPAFGEDLVSICRKKQIRFVWNQNGVGYRAWAGAAAELHNAPMRRLRAASDVIIYQSEFCQYSANHFLGPVGIPSQTLLNPVDLSRFSPSDVPKPHIPLRLLSMGTQNYPARVKHVIDALTELRHGGIDATLTIAGRLLWKDAEADIVRHATTRGVEGFVFRVGEFTQDMAVSLYRSHHILVHPKYLDPCPTVVAEAMACGLPVVGSKSGGMPEMVADGCGSLIPVPVNDWTNLHTPSGGEMATAIADLLPHMETFSTAARNHAMATFDATSWVQAHQKIFSGILS